MALPVVLPASGGEHNRQFSDGLLFPAGAGFCMYLKLKTGILRPCLRQGRSMPVSVNSIICRVCEEILTAAALICPCFSGKLKLKEDQSARENVWKPPVMFPASAVPEGEGGEYSI